MNYKKFYKFSKNLEGETQTLRVLGDKNPLPGRAGFPPRLVKNFLYNGYVEIVLLLEQN